MTENLLQISLINTAFKYPNKTAIICGRHKITYAEMNQLTTQLAIALKNLGLMRGDRVVIQLGNSVEAIIAFWAVLKADGIVSIIGEDVIDSKLNFILEDSGAKIFFAKEANVNEKFLSSKSMLPLEHLIVKQRGSDAASDNIWRFDQLISSSEDGLQNNCKALSIDLASIIYTSGSTGEPKGVMLTHANMIAAKNSIQDYLHYQYDDMVISALPIAFDYGLYQMILSFSCGATLILEQDFIWPLLFCRKITEYQATVVPLVPSMLVIISDLMQHKPQDFSSVRTITNTGAALTSSYRKLAKTIFSKADIFSMYGLTECKRCTFLPPEDIDRKPESIGIAIPNTELWIVDENNNPVGANQVGQLVVRGATVMKGYWNRPHETEEKLKDGLLPGEKVLYTGDYALVDEEGYLYFKGRMDEMIKSRGMKISPKEIEETIAQNSHIKEVAVVGVPDSKFGTAIWAFVSRRQSEKLDIEDIQQWCKQNLSKDKCPQQIILLNDLPKTQNGKINKKQLRQQALLLINNEDEVPVC